MKKFVLYCLLSLLVFSCSNKTPMQSNNQNKGPSSLNPGQPTARNYGANPNKKRSFWDIFKKKEVNWGDQLVAEYHERMEQNAKEAKKKAKEMEKPQYSNFRYFGHKKKPKKRPPGKMKFCEECGIKH